VDLPDIQDESGGGKDAAGHGGKQQQQQESSVFDGYTKMKRLGMVDGAIR
jgi:hypothetical protein